MPKKLSPTIMFKTLNKFFPPKTILSRYILKKLRFKEQRLKYWSMIINVATLWRKICPTRPQFCFSVIPWSESEVGVQRINVLIRIILRTGES